MTHVTKYAQNSVKTLRERIMGSRIANCHPFFEVRHLYGPKNTTFRDLEYSRFMPRECIKSLLHTFTSLRSRG